MFSVFTNAWKVKDIRKKLIYVLFVLLIYRLGTRIPLPGVDITKLAGASEGASALENFYSVIVGGGFGTLFAMGIGPYITSSIIMQLLTVAIPKLEQIQKEGEEGRKKINGYTRFVAVALAALQGAGMVYSLCHTSVGNLFKHPNYLVYAAATIGIVTGTIFIMWLSELLTEKGIGNGSSFIIFANILSGLPNAVRGLITFGLSGEFAAWPKIAVLVLLFIGLIAVVILVQDGERRIPVQYSKKMVGRQMFGGQTSFIPIKVNIAGVMSIIFAISLLQFPSTIYQIWKPVFLTNVVNILAITHPIGSILYVILIFCFTFFYTSFAINTVEMAENMKKNGGFIPGIRPGKPTSDYVQRTVDRLSWIGALFYAIIAMMPVLFQWIFGIRVGFSGTTLLIVTGVALEIVKQLESQLLMRHYKGFLK